MAEEQAGFLDKFSEFSAKVGNQIHLRSLRDAFATVMPIYIMAGLAVLINNVVFPLFWPKGSTELANVQTWGAAITQGTLSVAAILLAGIIGYCFAMQVPVTAVTVAAVVADLLLRRLLQLQDLQQQ